MVQNKTAVEAYFEREAKRFDDIYDAANKGSVHQLVDRLFRTRMLLRRNAAVADMVEKGANCLEVGCGSGRTAIELARTKHAKVHGLDLSSGILNIAEANADRAGCKDLCSFERADFLTWQPERSYGVLVGIGLLDYFDDPLPFLMKAADTVRGGSMILSYPVSWRLLNVVRRVWLNGFRKCPVHFYGHREIDALVSQVGGQVIERQISGGQWPFISDAAVRIALR
jgi:cyclopropane fatty-acyl-phospholipid synthase-like methyltransferase